MAKTLEELMGENNWFVNKTDITRAKAMLISQEAIDHFASLVLKPSDDLTTQELRQLAFLLRTTGHFFSALSKDYIRQISYRDK